MKDQWQVSGSERGSSVLRGGVDMMMQARGIETSNGKGVELTCTKMKDTEEFLPIVASLDKVDLGSGTSSLVIGGITRKIGNGAHNGASRLQQILTTDFAGVGATNTELYGSWDALGYGSKSSFNRALGEATRTGQIKKVGDGKGAKYMPVGVSVT